MGFCLVLECSLLQIAGHPDVQRQTPARDDVREVALIFHRTHCSEGPPPVTATTDTHNDNLPARPSQLRHEIKRSTLGAPLLLRGKRSREPALSAAEGDLHLFPSAEVDLLFAKRRQAQSLPAGLTPTPVIRESPPVDANSLHNSLKPALAPWFPCERSSSIVPMGQHKPTYED